MLPRILLKESIVAPAGFNRWRVPPASIAIHLCIGSVYAWSIYNPALTRELGVVTAASADWSLSSVVWVFSVAIVFLGLSAAVAGKWLEEVGPRAVGLTAALLWGGGYLVGAAGIATHQLWLVYAGYGVLGGCGLGLGYVSPVSTLIRWFPDRRGMATGMAIMGFGGGAMIGAPVKEALLAAFFRAPEYLGSASSVVLHTEAGRRFAETASGLREVVVASSADVASLPGGLSEGVYVVGTGSTGSAAAFLTLSIAYFVVMAVAAWSYRVPRPGWSPDGWREPEAAEAYRKMISRAHVHLDTALRTPQFYLLWIVLCFNVTAGIGVLGVAKTMMSEIFGTTLPHLVDGAFAATYVLMISVFNMVGRIAWSSASDHLGRKNTYHVFFVLGALLYVSIPFTAEAVSAAPSTTWLIVFYATTMLIFTMYGGGFATIPAYLADIFGSRFVGGIHGRLLTAWSTAGVLGPVAITHLRQRSEQAAIENLAAAVNPAAFETAFGAPVARLAELVQAKTVTVARLMEIAPAGTVDPTPGLYSTTMYAMAALLVIAFFANLAVRPVDAKHHLPD